MFFLSHKNFEEYEYSDFEEYVFFHSHFMEEELTLVSLGGIDPDPGAQPKKIMIGAFVVAQHAFKMNYHMKIH